MAKKITRLSLDGGVLQGKLKELHRDFSTLTEKEMRDCIGGFSNGYYDDNGWLDNGYYYRNSSGSGHWCRSYTWEEFDNWDGTWPGGWVEGMGWVLPDVGVYGKYKGGNGYSGNNHPNWSGNWGTSGGNTSGYSGYYNSYSSYYNYPGHNGYSGYKGYPGYYYYYYHRGGGSGNWGDSNNNENNSGVADPFEVIRGILNDGQGTYEQQWAAMENAYRNILSDIGVNMSGIDFYFLEGRAAKAWKVDTFGRDIAVGTNFFDLSVEDSISVLIHECMHVNFDAIISSSEKKAVTIDYYDNVPEHIKKFVIDTYFNGEKNEIELRTYFTVFELADPNHYKNEVNAYTKEKELCPDVSSDYEAERNFRIWYFQQQADLSEKYYR